MPMHAAVVGEEGGGRAMHGLAAFQRITCEITQHMWI